MKLTAAAAPLLALLLLAATAPPASASGRMLRGAAAATAAKGADAAAQNPYWNNGGGGWNNGGGWGGRPGNIGMNGGGWNNNWGGRNYYQQGPYQGYGPAAGGWNGGPRSWRGGRWRRGDRGALRGIMPTGLPPMGPVAARPFGPDATRFSDSIASADANAAARSMVSQRSDIVAQGIVDAAARGRRGRVADAFANAAALDRGATSRVLARSASEALAAGQTNAFADAAADAFVASRRRGSARPLGLAMADAVASGGSTGSALYGQAIAKAVAAGGEGQAAVAEATAEVFCAGGAPASAWSSAFAVALNQDENGCLVLNQARAMAMSSCGGGAFNSVADADATSIVLGFCGLGGPTFSYSSTDAGSNNWGRK
jgi:hypothetical protein